MTNSKPMRVPIQGSMFHVLRTFLGPIVLDSFLVVSASDDEEVLVCTTCSMQLLTLHPFRRCIMVEPHSLAIMTPSQAFNSFSATRRLRYAKLKSSAGSIKRWTSNRSVAGFPGFSCWNSVTRNMSLSWSSSRATTKKSSVSSSASKPISATAFPICSRNWFERFTDFPGRTHPSLLTGRLTSKSRGPSFFALFSVGIGPSNICLGSVLHATYCLFLALCSSTSPSRCLFSPAFCFLFELELKALEIRIWLSCPELSHLLSRHSFAVILFLGSISRSCSMSFIVSGFSSGICGFHFPLV
mmetsp:Transcript_19669/g.39860  ORF Transcript_19669/g.39860 Transcript_19669/m.39860 type:complete len:299 (+) Transcript_19669:173-1069(+)